MKLGNFLQDYSVELQKREKLDGLLNLADFLAKSNSETGRMQSIGIDTLVNSWVKQQLAYREQLTEDLMTIARSCSEIAAPLMHIRNEVFRKGMNFEPKFAKKCTECGTEYENLTIECEKCGDEGKLVDPDEEQLEVIKTFIDDCNIFDQDLETVLKQFHRDFNAVDDAYLYLNKEYYIDEDSKNNKKDIKSKVVEIRRLKPAVMEFDLDDVGLPKHKNWICLLHRGELPQQKENDDEVLYCKKDGCGCELVPVMYTYKYRGSKLYFTDSEICHQSKFEPTETYGYSPILIIFEKALTILGMDKTVFRYFYERKMPASMLMVATSDVESIRTARADLVAQLKANPDHIPMVGYTQQAGQRGRVDMVRLFHTLQEMDYLPVRQEIRERIAALWGLPPMWQSEHTGIGGLSGQSQQLVQFSRVVESDQRIFNTKVFPFILEAFGVTDWKLMLKQPEEKAEGTRISFAQQRAQIAGTLKQMGFTVEVKEGTNSIDDIDFKVSAAQEQEGQEDQGFGGMPFGMSMAEKGWVPQLLNKGYPLDNVGNVVALNNGTNALSFSSKGSDYIAIFNLGTLVDVMSYEPKQYLQKIDGKLTDKTEIMRDKPLDQDDLDDGDV